MARSWEDEGSKVAIMPSRIRATMAACLLSLAGCGQLGWDSDARVQNLLEYRAAFERALGGWAGSLDGATFADRVHAARVLWLGDHHLDGVLHRTQRDLLQGLVRSGRRCVLCLEAIGSEDDRAVANYLVGRSDQAQLRAAIAKRWSDSWLDSPGVDADHYRAVLALAREAAMPVVGLEPTPRLPLHSRDPEITETVRRMADAFPDRLVVVMVGQTHLLGQGNLIARTALPCVAIGARPPEELGPAIAPPDAILLRTGSGLLFFRSLVPDR
jgi:hypothetical protein